jgi:hypothetical protein
MRTRPERDPQQTAQCVYSIPCECGRSYTGETGRPLPVRLREHKHNLQQGLLATSKLAQRAYEEGHRVAGTIKMNSEGRCWDAGTPHHKYSYRLEQYINT